LLSAYLILVLSHSLLSTCSLNLQRVTSCQMAECKAINTTLKEIRKSYTREQKLDVLKWYLLNGRILYCTCQQFSLSTKTVLQWVKNQSAIYNSKKERKCVQFQRTADINFSGLYIFVWFVLLLVKQKILNLKIGVGIDLHNKK